MNKPKLTIVCQTYNQVKYIRQTLEGFVAQKTNFPFIVIVGDDCSTDGTTDIVKEFEQKYPDIIKAVYHKENTKGIGNSIDTFGVCESEYLAWCEGDDYWIDENKLQKQVDFLDNNPDYSICFHPIEILYENNEKENTIFPSKKLIKSQDDLTLENFLKVNFIQTNSVVYRWRFKKDKFEKNMPMDILPGDWYLHLLHAKIGKIKMLPDVMGVYRRQPNGIWYDSINNIERLHARHGVAESNLYRNIYENITDKSEKYLNEIFIPKLKEIMHGCYSYGNFEALEEIKKKNIEVIEKIFPLVEGNIYKVKCKKYKKLFNVFLIAFVVACVILIALFILFMLKG